MDLGASQLIDITAAFKGLVVERARQLQAQKETGRKPRALAYTLERYGAVLVETLRTITNDMCAGELMEMIDRMVWELDPSLQQFRLQRDEAKKRKAAVISETHISVLLPERTNRIFTASPPLHGSTLCGQVNVPVRSLIPIEQMPMATCLKCREEAMRRQARDTDFRARVRKMVIDRTMGSEVRTAMGLHLMDAIASTHPRSRIWTEEKRLDVMFAYWGIDSGDPVSQVGLARRYGVSASQIRHVIQGALWNSVRHTIRVGFPPLLWSLWNKTLPPGESISAEDMELARHFLLDHRRFMSSHSWAESFLGSGADVTNNSQT